MESDENLRWEPPSGEPDAGSPSSESFVRLACLDYAAWRPSWGEAARRMLASHPEVARTDVSAAAAAGDTAAAEELLSREPALLHRKAGALAWEPLLYACYSRLPDEGGRSTLEVARLLLARGADPNAGFLWKGNVPPFTALTGAFGNGEGGASEPAHPRMRELARLLLDAGADPNDGQTLYDLHFGPNDEHLRLLFSYGLGQEKGGPWFGRLGDRLQSPARMLVEELWSAARKGYRQRVELLVAHGADVNTPGVRDGRTPYQAARRAGNDEIAEYLVALGARRVPLDAEEAFAAACISGRRAEARALLEKEPALLATLDHHARVELLHRAVESRRPEGIRLMAELGFPVSGVTKHDGVGINLAATPLHNAAWMGDLEMVKLLLELGADASVRDPQYGGTPRDWAAHNGQQAVVDFLYSGA